MAGSSAFSDFAERLAGDIPEILYHYTSVESLRSIVEGGSLWATEAGYLNDASEVVRSLEIAMAAAHELRTPGAPEALSASLDRFCKFIQKELGAAPSFASFVASFSVHPASLNLWRIYSGRFGGAALGISPEVLVPEIRRLRGTIARCIYDEEVLRDFIRQLLAEVSTFDQREVVSLAAKVVSFAPQLKDSSFEEEDEIRVVLTHDRSEPLAPVKFRTAGWRLIPYVEIPLVVEGKWSIREVRIGPSPHRVSQRRAVDWLCRRIPECKVIENPSEYLGW